FHLWNADFRLTGMVISNGRTGDGFHSGILTCINQCIGNLENAVLNKDPNSIYSIASEIISLLEERNRRLRLVN
ncbi:hypothetical protein, partial [Hornefia butyriciproducens]|uniref:hypothetical protein n=1 Tax=Hornefia butyriciproducens TaxID=2652293 RepID=UPI003F8B56F0